MWSVCEEAFKTSQNILFYSASDMKTHVPLQPPLVKVCGRRWWSSHANLYEMKNKENSDVINNWKLICILHVIWNDSNNKLYSTMEREQILKKRRRRRRRVRLNFKLRISVRVWVAVKTFESSLYKNSYLLKKQLITFKDKQEKRLSRPNLVNIVIESSEDIKFRYIF